MGLRISTNISSIAAQRSMSNSTREVQKSFAQLATGSRITKAADDAAGLSISETLKSTIRGYGAAQRNANDGISMVQTAEGGLNEIGNVIVRMRELGIQAASDTVSYVERGFIDKEIQQLKNEMQRIASVTTWGKTKLLDGSTPVFDFQVGIYNDDFEDRISFDASQNVATLDALGLAGMDYNDKANAQQSLVTLDAAQEAVNGMRSNLGALQNRLVSTVQNLGVFEENMAAANSRIRDTDMAHASSELTRNTIMLQASTSALAQANQVSNVALKLING